MYLRGRGHKCDVRYLVDREVRPRPFRWEGPRVDREVGGGRDGRGASMKGARSTTCVCSLNGMSPTCIERDSAPPRVQLVWVFKFAPSISIRSSGLMRAVISCARSCLITTIWEPGSKTPGSRVPLQKSMSISCKEREYSGSGSCFRRSSAGDGDSSVVGLRSHASS